MVLGAFCLTGMMQGDPDQTEGRRLALVLAPLRSRFADFHLLLYIAKAECRGETSCDGNPKPSVMAMKLSR